MFDVLRQPFSLGLLIKTYILMLNQTNVYLSRDVWICILGYVSSLFLLLTFVSRLPTYQPKLRENKKYEKKENKGQN